MACSPPFRQRFSSQFRHFSSFIDSVPSPKKKFIPSSGSYPKGFSASGIYVGIKPTNTHLPDLALVSSEKSCSAAAVFTQNKFQAAPVLVSKEILKRCNKKGIRAIIVNSGCANAVTGKDGIEDATKMTHAVDACIFPSSSLSSPSPQNGTLVMSTGVIGQRLPISKILTAIPLAHQALTLTHSSWLTAARAICTTDTFPKLLSRTFTLPSSPQITYSIAGMTKGAGMMHPNMATLLGIITTDAPVTPPILSGLLTHAVSRSFNCISVDGDTSTNDTVALLANGAAGGPEIASLSTPDGIALQDTLTSFTQELSQLIVRDGEGATKFVRVRIINASSFHDAHCIASTIARSPLVKTALYGKDANWGRILCAVGYTPGLADNAIVPERTSVSFVPVDGSPELKLLVKGEPEDVDEARAKEILEDEDLEIRVDLGTGREEASYWFCDFSHGYVEINADYRT